MYGEEELIHCATSTPQFLPANFNFMSKNSIFLDFFLTKSKFLGISLEFGRFFGRLWLGGPMLIFEGMAKVWRILCQTLFQVGQDYLSLEVWGA